MDRAECLKCRANLRLPAARRSNLPIPSRKRQAAALALSAAAVVARVGFTLLKDQVLPRLADSLADWARGLPTERKASEVIEPEPKSAEEPDYTIRGWRAWSVRRGQQETSGSERFEWNVSRRRDGGAERK